MQLIRYRRQAGDTIVEVLISIGIISLVLAAAYTITNRNSMLNLETGERAQAQKLVERQIELLRTSTESVNGKCFDSAGTLQPAAASQCTMDSEGNTHAGSSAAYKVSINDAGGAGKYKIEASWDTTASSKGHVTMYYQK